jgi:hypothetical protein
VFIVSAIHHLSIFFVFCFHPKSRPRNAKKGFDATNSFLPFWVEEGALRWMGMQKPKTKNQKNFLLKKSSLISAFSLTLFSSSSTGFQKKSRQLVSVLVIWLWPFAIPANQGNELENDLKNLQQVDGS